jgi:Na+-driven multidrug efflux pump
VLNKPLHSACLTLIQAFILYIPAAYVASQTFGLKGIFTASVVSYLIAAMAAFIWLKRLILDAQQQ